MPGPSLPWPAVCRDYFRSGIRAWLWNTNTHATRCRDIGRQNCRRPFPRPPLHLERRLRCKHYILSASWPGADVSAWLAAAAVKSCLPCFRLLKFAVRLALRKKHECENGNEDATDRTRPAHAMLMAARLLRNP